MVFDVVIGVHGTKAVRNTMVLALMFIPDTCNEIDKIVRSDKTGVRDAAGALRLT